MKILITFFSQSGNTEKIAKALWEEVSPAHDTDCKKLEDVSPEETAGYDVVFIGSPLHGGSLAAPVQEFLSNIKPKADQKMAGFITHFAPAYPEQDMNQFTEPIQAACKKNDIKYIGCFDCQGALAESMHEAVQNKLGLSDEDWAGMVTQMTGHPNAEDITNAKACAKGVLA